jgi:aspartyl-tRNA(Asn)/glutamyl-tRNA(Gln) amidotransferase subunit A
MTPSILDRTEDYLGRSSRHDADLRAFISVRNEAARREAAQLDGRLRNGDCVGLPAGCVIAFKDNIDISGKGTTLGLGFHSDRVPNRDAKVVRRLCRAGPVVVGKTNLHELAFDATTQNPHFGPCRNPWDTERIAGGSSGGSASAVAAGMCEVALGADTGGSIRVPASDGRERFEPGRRVSRSRHRRTDGADYGRHRGCLRGYRGLHPEDELRVDQPVEGWLNAAARGLGGLRIGIARPGQFQDVDPPIETAARNAAIVFAELGAMVRDVDLGDPDSLHARLKLLVPTNIAARNRKRLKEHPETFGPDVCERMSLGLTTAGVDYADWLRLIEGWQMQARRQFESIDIIVTPTVASPAPLAAASTDMIATTAGLTRLTFIWSYLRLPALSVPCGFTASNLPVGMQLIGPQWSEARLLAAGPAYQDVTDFHRRRPPAYA